MRLIKSEEELNFPPLVATIGFFDGVHLGHRYLIKQVNKVALESNLHSAVITFMIHPYKILHPLDYCPPSLCTSEEKVKHLFTTGVDYCISLDFTKELSVLTAENFMLNILQQRFNVTKLIIGYDHKFGHNCVDNFENYYNYGAKIGMEVIRAEEFPNLHISSSGIRQLLTEGRVEEAAKQLTYNYSIGGTVVEGFKLGRTIGFPTANLEPENAEKVIPSFGVYAVYVYIDNSKYEAMLYIGNRPTVANGSHTTIEANIFDFDDDIYGKYMRIEFVKFIRYDKKFNSVVELKKQIQDDKNVIQYFFQISRTLNK